LSYFQLRFFRTPERILKTMKVPFFDLVPQFASLQHEIRLALDEVFKTQQFIMGPQIEALEKTIAQFCGSRYAIGVASGSDALLLSLMACGIGSGDEVLLPPFTFFATAGAVSRLGATPVFVDIDSDTYNIDPGKIETRITSRTRAILPVHLYGQCADMDPILEVSKRRGLLVIEDAAQAIGAEYRPRPDRPGRQAGTLGDVGCFSFFPTKNLGAFGDAGMVVTDHPERAEEIRCLRVHGSKPKYYHKRIGINSRLDTLQAAVLLVKFRHLETWTQERRRKAERYRHLVQDLLPLVPEIRLPEVQYTNRHIYNQFILRVPRRDTLRQFLQKEGVGTEIYYPVALHLQECFAYLNYRRGDFPESEKASEETLALPIFPELTEVQQEYVVNRIRAFYLG